MLSHAQLRHFADHGWVLLEGVLDEDACQRYIDRLDHCRWTRKPAAESGELVDLCHVLLYDDLFVEWFKLPGIIDANRQLAGADVRFLSLDAHIKAPHPDRHSAGERLRDPDAWSWHRALRPKWGTFADDADPELVNCALINNITFLTPVSPADGGTALLDGSHRLEGDYASLNDQCDVVEVTAEAGSVVLMSEALIHAPAPILSERARHNMYCGFVHPWLGSGAVDHVGYDVPQVIVDSWADEELRALFGPSTYKGQHPVAVPQLA